MKLTINGIDSRMFVEVEALKHFQGGTVKLTVTNNNSVQAVQVNPAEAIALADTLLAAVKYLCSKK